MSGPAPTDDELLAAAGSARYGRVLVRGRLDRLAIGVVDANGDGAMFTVTGMTQADDGLWRECAWNSAGVLARGWTAGVAYAYGRADDAESVEIGFRGEFRRVPVNEHGWWMVLVAADESDGLDLTHIPNWPTSHAVGGDAPPRVAG